MTQESVEETERATQVQCQGTLWAHSKRRREDDEDLDPR